MDLSIIVPAYNSEKYLHRCLDSLVRQSGELNYEIVIVDDGSVDRTGEICRKYKNNYRNIKVIHKKNGGLSSARNAGLAIAEGEFVGFVDSDDWVGNDMYCYLLKLAKDLQADIVSGKYYSTNKEIEVMQENEQIKCFYGNDKVLEYLRIGLREAIAEFTVCNKIYRRNLFENIRFPEGQIYEDMVTNFSLLIQARKWVLTNRTIYYYFENEGGITTSPFSSLDYNSLEKVGSDFLKEAYRTGEKAVIEMAKVQNIKLKLSGLRKIILYGIDSGIENPKAIVRAYEKEIRMNLKTLLLSPLKPIKKVQTVVLAVNAGLVVTIFRKIKWGR